jgi:hypothetical protein
MLHKRMGIVALVLCMLLGACAQDGDVPQATDTPHGDPPYAVIAAEQALSDELGVPVDEIDYVSYERQEWPDACLGLAEEGEMCAQVITPGWRVVLKAQGQEFVFRTDQDGEIVRRED